MTTQALNFLWLNLDIPAPADPEEGGIRVPMPAEYLKNVAEAAKDNPGASIRLWVDSERLTARQMKYIKALIEPRNENAEVKDLRGVPEYASEEFYSRPEKNRCWRDNYFSTIWGQVDSAKILVSLQGDFDQSFFADMDLAHVKINGKAAQKKLSKAGFFVGSASGAFYGVENQLWGFTREKRGFFEAYYKDALEDSIKGDNGYEALHSRVHDFIKRKNLPLSEVCLLINGKGMEHATQPGHEWSGERGGQYAPKTISAQRLKKVFNIAARKAGGKAGSKAQAQPARKAAALP